MIRVTVEIWPNGAAKRRRVIARMHIDKISDLSPTSAHEVVASSVADRSSGKPAFEARGLMEGHRRRDSIWALLSKATAWAADLARR